MEVLKERRLVRVVVRVYKNEETSANHSTRQLVGAPGKGTEHDLYEGGSEWIKATRHTGLLHPEQLLPVASPPAAPAPALELGPGGARSKLGAGIACHGGTIPARGELRGEGVFGGEVRASRTRG